MIAEDEREIERWRGQAPVIVIGRAEADPVDLDDDRQNEVVRYAPSCEFGPDC